MAITVHQQRTAHSEMLLNGCTNGEWLGHSSVCKSQGPLTERLTAE